jgi:iron complex outermembrane receptor protein
LKKLVLAFTALLLPFLAAAQFSLSGKITDHQTGQPLPGATVSLIGTGFSTATGTDGNYSLNNLPAALYRIRITYIGYVQEQHNIRLAGNQTANLALAPSNFLTEEVTVSATRARKNSPIAFTNLSKKDLDKNNLGQDLPYLLNQTPSTVVTSDAGTGVGYTGLRIRGSDLTRINVTINGIPYNDSESQGSYFVDLPDFASSVNNIQIQRGVGTSTNGAGAFGASINIQTNTRRDTAYAEINTAAGSYGTIKNTISAGTGLLGGHFSLDGRLSRIASDGYIDRASSNLRSFFVSGAYYGKNTTIRANVFSGVERTYQAWNGVNADSVYYGNRRYNELGLMPNGQYYNNQTDNYTQNHYQLLVDQKFSDKFSFSGALHYTKGYGYYEEYKTDQSVANYGLKPVIIGADTLATTDLVRRLWLNNDFYGVTYNFHYRPVTGLNLTLGGAYNQYKGAHYNNIEWTQQSTTITPDYEYSRNNAKKNDFNIFARADYQVGKFLLYGDLQYRNVYYSFFGLDRNLNDLQQAVTLNFFNPKVGLTYELDQHNNVYTSFAVGNREPNRDDFVNSTPLNRPKAENLKDFEAGYRTTQGIFSGGLNGFYMLYKNQLILTGALNDVGEAIRTNVKDSYRAGLELDARLRFSRMFSWGVTGTLSTNKIKNYTQYFSNYDDGTLAGETFAKTDIAYSPSFIGSSELSFSPFKGSEIALLSKYISHQYLDNTMNTNPSGFTVAPNDLFNPYAANREIKGYFVSDVRLRYNFSLPSVKNIGITLLVNNIFGKKYVANGATYPDIEGGHVANYNYYYPQAPTNFLAALSLAF